jgi:PAS domain-containing protein
VTFAALAALLAALIGLTGYALWLLRADTLADALLQGQLPSQSQLDGALLITTGAAAHVLGALLAVLLASAPIISWLAFALYRRQVLIEQHRSEVCSLQQGKAALVFSHTSEGILITDAAANILDVNNAFTLITGYSR